MPIYRQIYWRFRDAIVSGKLRAGERVPSVRTLAAELNLARGTVEAAYQMLIGEGYLVSHGPAGTMVAHDLYPAEPPVLEAVVTEHESLVHTGVLPLPLQMGLPALDAFPRKLWIRLASRTLRQGGLDGLVYPDPRGHASLRTALAGYLGIARGISCSSDQIFVCAGYRACLELIYRSLLRVGDHGWFEEPGYFIAREFLKEIGLEPVPIPVDSAGLDVQAAMGMAPDARFALVTPSHQSPLGVSLTLPRRQALLDWAMAQESWIIEDDYDSEYRYRGRPLPALKSLDSQGRVLYIGTFSKVLMPGLRLAYVVVPQAQVKRFAYMADTLQNHCPHVLQSTVATFIEEGHFGRHIKKMRALYPQRRALLIEALLDTLGSAAHIDPQAGGMHIIVRLAPEYDDRIIADRAQKAGLAVQALSRWYAGPETSKGLLLGFTNVQNKTQSASLAARLHQCFQVSADKTHHHS
ncbi:GntR family transcriptional regulator [Pseudomonas asuensis]|uniref:GntR family transcriptional regulator n=1 Tax=Pseudomonas asuensis TaxID=1825787 RepID=A0ABQ2H2L9_9PSED|nr:PLP-dependent aminotransferase family protein [Pseudomonas asuensis]GGM29667.1 GntR family transcriptional regulator [Pseudomonas asuensis]